MYKNDIFVFLFTSCDNLAQKQLYFVEVSSSLNFHSIKFSDQNSITGVKNGASAAFSDVFDGPVHSTVSQFRPVPTRSIFPSILRRREVAYPSTPPLALRSLPLSSAQNRHVYPQRRPLCQPSPVRGHSSDGVSECYLQHTRRHLAHGDLPSPSASRLRESYSRYGDQAPTSFC